MRKIVWLLFMCLWGGGYSLHAQIVHNINDNTHLLPENPADSIPAIEYRLKEALRHNNAMGVATNAIALCEYRYLLNADNLPLYINKLRQYATRCSDNIARALLWSYEAELTHRYFQRNRYTIGNRAGINANRPRDMREWCTDDFVCRIADLLDSSLYHQDTLLRTPIEVYDLTIHREEQNRILRPTTFDFLTHRAIGLYSNLISQYPSPLIRQEIFVRPSKIIPNPIAVIPDSYAIKARIVNIYDRLLTLHHDSTSAYMMCHLEREKFLQRFCPDSTYHTTLYDMYHRYVGNPYATEILIEIGRGLNENNFGAVSNWITCVREQITRHPDYFRIDCLKNSYNRFVAPRFHASIPETLSPDITHRISFSYKNIRRLYADITPAGQNSDSTASTRMEIPIEGGSFTPERQATWDIPALSPGLYDIRFTADGEFTSHVSRQIAVSRLFAYTQASDSAVNIIVTNHDSGHPLPNSEIRLYRKSAREHEYLRSVLSDTDGVATISDTAVDCIAPVAEGDSCHPRIPIYFLGIGRHTSDGTATPQARFFTDRAIYRPGDTLQYAGVLFVKEEYTRHVVPDKKFSISLLKDGLEIAKQEVNSDKYGSFSGKFIIPQYLTGQLSLKCEYGHIVRTVSEYKKNTFEILLQQPCHNLCTDTAAIISGKVSGYAGDMLSNSSVSYTIKRLYPARDNRIAIGTTTTDSAGKFDIEFTPTLPSGETFASYTLAVSATAPNGEVVEQSCHFFVTDKQMSITISLPEYIEKGRHINLPIIISPATNASAIAECRYHIYALSPSDTLPSDETTSPDLTTFTPTHCIKKGKFYAGDTPRITPKHWKSGAYRIVVEATNCAGAKETQSANFILYSPHDKKPGLAMAQWVPTRSYEIEKGGRCDVIYGTSWCDVSILCQLFDGRTCIKQYRRTLHNENISIPIYEKEFQSPALSLHLSFVKDGKVHRSIITIRKQHSEELQIIPQSFRDYTTSGSREHWKFTLKIGNKRVDNARVFATMYDRSLDKLSVNHWNRIATDFYTSPYMRYSSPGHQYFGIDEYPETACAAFKYDRLHLLTGEYTEDVFLAQSGLLRTNYSHSADFANSVTSESAKESASTSDQAQSESFVRDDFRETAFFYPAISCDKKGRFEIFATLPDGLTSWRLMLYALSDKLQDGIYIDTIITAKPLMVMPNLPRYIRIGDRVSISTRISNTGKKELSGELLFELFNPADSTIIHSEKSDFRVGSEGMTSISNQFSIDNPDITIVGVRIRATTNVGMADGEQRLLPVLPAKIILTEAQSLHKLDDGSYEIAMKSIAQTPEGEETLCTSLNYTASSLWAIIQALPGIVTPSNDNFTAELLTALYSNGIANAILQANPSFVSILQKLSAQTNSSPLSQNNNLKSILLEETPWAVIAHNDNERIAELHQLLDNERIILSCDKIMEQLQSIQNDDGSFPWYKGMTGNISQTLSVLEYLPTLKKWGISNDNLLYDIMQRRALEYLTERILDDTTRHIHNTLHTDDIRYLIVKRTFRHKLTDIQEAKCDTLYHRALARWRNSDLYHKSLIARLVHVSGDTLTARRIATSIAGYSTTQDNFTTWANINSTGHTISDIALHAFLTETIELIEPTSPLLPGLKRWLLLQKEARYWGTATTTLSVLHCLTQGTNFTIPEKSDFSIIWGSDTITGPAANCGYTQISKSRNEITPAHSRINLTSQGNSEPQATLYRQYSTDIDKIAQVGNELSMQKELFIIVGDTLVPIGDRRPRIGDRIHTRLIVTCERALDFVVINDNRAACLEPIEQLPISTYQQRSSARRESRDSSTRFYIEHLPQGYHIYAYDSYIDRAGSYHTGCANVQCLYAPQFTAHSDGGVINIE
ncbi:MAG: hypothetical protein IJY36_01605 [Coprobacter sp.]|nr:hypothetical protein [Coprobacter sp.]